MAAYTKSLFFYILLFAVLYVGLTITINIFISNAPSQRVINIINILTFSCWGISAYLFASRIGRYGFLNGTILGLATVAIVVPLNTSNLFTSATDLQATLIPIVGTSLFLGFAGGAIYDLIHLFKRAETRNKGSDSMI